MPAKPRMIEIGQNAAPRVVKRKDPVTFVVNVRVETVQVTRRIQDASQAINASVVALAAAVLVEVRWVPIPVLVTIEPARSMIRAARSVSQRRKVVVKRVVLLHHDDDVIRSLQATLALSGSCRRREKEHKRRAAG